MRHDTIAHGRWQENLARPVFLLDRVGLYWYEIIVNNIGNNYSITITDPIPQEKGRPGKIASRHKVLLYEAMRAEGTKLQEEQRDIVRMI
jgi:hypothetical protein